MILRLLSPTRLLGTWERTFDGARPSPAHAGAPIRVLIAPRARRSSEPRPTGPDRGAA